MVLRRQWIGLASASVVLAGAALLFVSAAAAQGTTIKDRKGAQAALHAGYKSLQAKNTKQAITDLSRAIKSGKLRSNEMAKALYYRGQAYRAAKRPADAIADLTSALWMKGALSERERKAAMALRQKTYQQLGVSGPALAFGSTTTTTAATPAPASSATPRAPRPSTAAKPAKPTNTNNSWTVSTAPAQPTANANPLTTATNGVTSFFNNLFGGASNSTTTGSLSGQSQSSAGQTSQSAAGWQSQTKASSAARTRVARAQPRAVASPNSGRYFIQVASVRDPGQARTLASTVASRHKALLQGRQPAVETGVLGNMGKFYHVRVRSFRSASDASKLCKKLIASGLDCLVNKS